MRSEKLAIIKDIKPMAADQYDRVLAEYVEYVSRFNFVRAVYQIGSISTPGISDLDLIVVVEKGCDPMSAGTLSVLQNRPKEIEKYIFIHDVYVYDTDSFQNLPFNLHFDRLKQLYGKPYQFEALTAVEKKILSLQIVFDFVSSRLAQFAQIRHSGKLSLRGLLIRVASLRHTYSLIRNLDVRDALTESFLERVMEIRRTWHRQSDQTFTSLFLESFSYFNRLVHIAASEFVDQHLNFFSDVDNGTSMRLNQNQILRFVDQPFEHGNDYQVTDTIYYPQSVFYHYLAYARFPHFVGKSAACGISHSGTETFDLSTDYLIVLEKRLKSIVDQMAFLKKCRAYFSMGGYPGFLIPWDGVVTDVNATDSDGTTGGYAIACLQKSPMNKVIDQSIQVMSASKLAHGLGMDISKVQLEGTAYARWVADFFPDWQQTYGHLRHKKLIELYTSYVILSPEKDDVYMDVAGGFNSYIHRLSCKRRLIQNIIVPRATENTGGNLVEFIQGDTANIPLPDLSCTKLSCHHSFEHFQNDSDSAFLLEAQRLLAIGGKCCILPIFIADHFVEVTRRYRPQFQFDPASTYLMDPTARITGGDSCGDYARIYDIPAFNRRVLQMIDTTYFRVHLDEVFMDGDTMPDMDLPCHKGITRVNFPYRCLTIERIQAP